MATRTEPIPVNSSVTWWWCWSVGGARVGAAWPGCDAPLRALSDPRALSGDELAEPADLAVNRLETVLLQLERVAVELLSGAPQRAGHLFPSLLEPTAPALEDLQPDVRVGLGEEREPHPEAVVVPCGRATFGELLLQSFLALRRELVDDPAAPARSRLTGLGVGRDQPAGKHLLEARVERAVGDRPQRTEERVDPLAQFVAVQRRLVQQTENGELEHAGPSAHRRPPSRHL